MAGLTAINGSGTQSATESPQNSSGSAAPTVSTTSVQPGTATNLLSDQAGVALHSTALSTVNLNSAAAEQTSTQAAPAPTPTPIKHSANYVLLGAAAVLLLVAVAMFWLVPRSVKSTT